MNEKQQNTMLAFSEWMDENTDGYIITYTNRGESGLVAHGDDEELATSLAAGMLKNPELRRVILKAVGKAFSKNNTEQ